MWNSQCETWKAFRKREKESFAGSEASEKKTVDPTYYIPDEI